MLPTLRYLMLIACLLPAALSAHAGRPSAPDTLRGTPDSSRERVEPKALETVRRMGGLLTGLKQFSFEAEETNEQILPDTGQKVQVTDLRRVVVARPARLAGSVKGDTSDRQFFYDGAQFAMLDRDKNVYATFPVSGPIENVLDELHRRHQVSVPLADLFFPNPEQVLLEQVDTGRWLGLHTVEERKCHHLAFTQRNIDWQLWVDAGEKPWPRKLVITYRRQPGEPQYIAVLRDWDTRPDVREAVFRFTPPRGAVKVEPFGPAAPGSEPMPPALRPGDAPGVAPPAPGPAGSPPGLRPPPVKPPAAKPPAARPPAKRGMR
jgi:hypothetical protein